LSLREQLVADFPTRSGYRWELARSQSNLAALLDSRGRPAEAERVLRQALTALEKLTAEAPTSADYRHELAETWTNLAGLLTPQQRRREAEQALRQAVALHEKLAAEFPCEIRYRARLAPNHHYLANLLEDTGRYAEAEQEYRRAADLFGQLADESPGNPLHGAQLAQSCRDLGDLLWDTGHPLQAAPLFERARARLEKLLADNPGVGSYARDLARLLVESPDPQLRDRSRAVELARQAVERLPTDWRCWYILGVTQYRAGQWRAALEALNRSRELHQVGTRSRCFFLAMAHGKLGEKDQARQWYDRACAGMRKDEPGYLRLVRYRAEAAAVLGLLPPEPGGPPPGEPTPATSGGKP
jgi:tetratricopeptide (TPR) repeat protein